jgi:transposase
MRLPPLPVTDEDRVVLESTARSRTAAARDVQRARIVLRAAADGWSNRAIGVEVGLHYNQVAVWRDRYRDEGLAGAGGHRAAGPAAGV